MNGRARPSPRCHPAELAAVVSACSCGTSPQCSSSVPGNMSAPCAEKCQRRNAGRCQRRKFYDLVADSELAVSQREQPWAPGAGSEFGRSAGRADRESGGG